MTKNITFAHRNINIQIYHLDMLIALLPVIAVTVLQSGTRGIVLMASAALAGVITDRALRFIRGKKEFNVYPLTSGLLFAFVCPLSAPVWFVAMGAATSVAVCELLGFFGKSYSLNPSAFSWLVFILAAPKIMGIFPAVSSVQSLPPFADPGEFDAAESVLYQLRTGFLPNYSFSDLLLGKVSGGFGAVALGAIAVSFIYLAVRKAIAFEVTVSLLLTVFLLTAAFQTISAPVYQMYFLQLSGGSLLFAAVFIAPGRGAPQTAAVRIAYGIVLGILVVVLRIFHFGEFSVPFSVVVCQITANLFDKFVFRKIHGFCSKLNK